MTNNSRKRKRRHDHEKLAAWARSLAPLASQASSEAYLREVASRIVPEISTKAWAKIEPYIVTVNRFDAYDLMRVTGYARGTVSRKQWLRSIVRRFPDDWVFLTVGGEAGGWRQVVIRKGATPHD